MAYVSQTFCNKSEIVENYLNHSFFLMVVALLCLLNIFSCENSYAAGTIAGTDVLNTAVVNYSIDNKPQPLVESSPTGNTTGGTGNGQPTSFVVDRKIDLNVTSNGNTSVTLGETETELTFTLLNEGNDSQEFMLIAESNLTSDDFDTSSCTTTVTSVLPGSPLPTVTLPTTGNIKLKSDQKAEVSIKCNIPLSNNGTPIEAGDTSLVSLYAVVEKNIDGTLATETTTTEDENSVDTVFADNAGTDDSLRDAAHSSRGSYITLDSTVVVPPTLSIDKTIVKIKDPSGGNTSITGSEITYQIKITTSGEGVIDNVVITDPTPAEMSYKTGSLTLDSSSLTDIDDADKASFDLVGDLATINLGNLTAGTQHDIQLTYIIN